MANDECSFMLIQMSSLHDWIKNNPLIFYLAFPASTYLPRVTHLHLVTALKGSSSTLHAFLYTFAKETYPFNLVNQLGMERQREELLGQKHIASVKVPGV